MQNQSRSTGMKIAVIGGGPTHTPELVNGFLARVDRLPLKELWLMDIDPERLFPSYVESLKQEAKPEWDVPTLESLGMIPNCYLQYFYYTDKKLEEQKKWPPSRAEQVISLVWSKPILMVTLYET